MRSVASEWSSTLLRWRSTGELTLSFGLSPATPCRCDLRPSVGPFLEAGVEQGIVRPEGP